MGGADDDLCSRSIGNGMPIPDNKIHPCSARLGVSLELRQAG